jgi:Protease inhibitor Inh
MRAISGSFSTVVLAGLMLAGCQSDRINGIDTAPTPVYSAPAGTVASAPLPAPTAPKPIVPPVTDATQFPSAPTPPVSAATPTVPNTQVASATGPDITIGAVAGVWNVSLSGQSCKVATPQTKFGQGFRAGPLKCPAEMANVKSWNVAGKQLVMYDEAGATIARLYSTGTGFSGQTAGGAPISFSR